MAGVSRDSPSRLSRATGDATGEFCRACAGASLARAKGLGTSRFTCSAAEGGEASLGTNMGHDRQSLSRHGPDTTSAARIQGRKIRILVKRVKLSLADRTRARVSGAGPEFAGNPPPMHAAVAPTQVAPTINRRNIMVKSNLCDLIFWPDLTQVETCNTDEVKSTDRSRTPWQPLAAGNLCAVSAI